MPIRIILDDGQRLGKRHRFLVGPFRGQGVENIDDREYPGDTGNRVAAQPIGITRSVEALVVMANGQRRAFQPWVIRDDLDAEQGMGFHDLKLIVRQLTGLEQDTVGNADLAHIVKEGAGDQFRNVLLWQTHGLGKCDGIEGDPVVVGIRVRIPLGNRIAEIGPRR